MVHLIDKDALVAEIKKLKAELPKNRGYKRNAYNHVLHIIDSFEVKEVDLDKEWEEYFKHRGDMATVNIKHLAKHFFELGMSVSNKAQKGEEV